MAIYKRDIADINLETGNIHRSFLNHSIGYMDQKADHFGIRVFRNGEPVDLTGVSVQGVFMPPQGSPIAITSGNIVSGNVAEVVLPQACYNYDGQFCLSIKLVDSTNSVTGTMRIVDGMVDNTHASGTVAPTAAVPTYQEVLSVYENMVETLEDYQEVVDTQNGQISDLKSALSQKTDNLFDAEYAKANASNITYANGEFSGKTSDFASFILIPHDKIEQGTFTISFYAYTEQNASSTGDGLGIYVKKQDNTNASYKNLSNTVSAWAKIVWTFTIDSTGYLVRLGTGGGNNNIWHVKDIQIETGSEATKYLPQLTAKDDVAENTAHEQNKTVYENAQNQFNPLTAYGTHTDATNNGVTFTWQSDNETCKVTGKSSASNPAVNVIYNSSSIYPPGMKNREPIFIVSSSNPEHLYAQLLYYVNGSLTNDRISLKDGVTKISIPSNITGIQIRLYAESGSYGFDDTIKVSVFLRNGMYIPSFGLSAFDTTEYIEEALNNYGECHLGTGLYAVSGIDMPEGSILCGSGESTVIRLLGVTAGYAIKMASNCTVRDLLVECDSADITIREDITNAAQRDGILWQGDYSTTNDKDNQPSYGTIDGVCIRRCKGGGIRGKNTGPQVNHGLNVTNVDIYNCNVGIYLSNECEFNRFTNVMAYLCYYGCVNNSGNNMFVNCGFSNNKVGMTLKKFYSGGNETANDTHGSAIGCVFNHMDRDDITLGSGEAIHFEKCTNGFVFDGCQLFYGKIYLEDCTGVMLTNCLFGVHKNSGGTTDGYPVEIKTTDSSNRGVFFNACNFTINSPPTFTVTEAVAGHLTVRMDACYNRKGVAITYNPS
ncbi:MAG: hypothetical protein J6S83_13560 [Lachnospiraceae bacterium]|nr:hypothetical protein [Lachnospiraceae bacterium]